MGWTGIRQRKDTASGEQTGGLFELYVQRRRGRHRYERRE